MRRGPLPSSISNETVPLDHRRADATIAPRTTTSSASSPSPTSPVRISRAAGSEAVPSERAGSVTRSDSMPPNVERLPSTSTRWPRRSRPASPPRRRRIAPVPSCTTAVCSSRRPVGIVTTPRMRTRVPVAAARAARIGVTPSALGEGVCDAVGDVGRGRHRGDAGARGSHLSPIPMSRAAPPRPRARGSSPTPMRPFRFRSRSRRGRGSRRCRHRHQTPPRT